MADGLQEVALTHPYGTDEQNPLFACHELATGQVSDLPGRDLGVAGKIICFQRLDLLEPSPGYPPGEPLVGPTLQLILKENLQNST
jgi:hypothetical protein